MLFVNIMYLFRGNFCWTSKNNTFAPTTLIYTARCMQLADKGQSNILKLIESWVYFLF